MSIKFLNSLTHKHTKITVHCIYQLILIKSKNGIVHSVTLKSPSSQRLTAENVVALVQAVPWKSLESILIVWYSRSFMHYLFLISWHYSLRSYQETQKRYKFLFSNSCIFPVAKECYQIRQGFLSLLQYAQKNDMCESYKYICIFNT